MRSSWWRVTQPAKASTRKCRAWGMAGGYMAQTRPSPTLSRGFTRLGRFLAPYEVIREPGAVLWPAREDHPDLEAPVHSALHAGVDGSGATIAHALTDDAPTGLTLIDAIDGDLTSVTADGPARRALVVPAGGVPRRLVTSSRRQTLAWAGGRRGRSARFGGGSPDSADGSRVLPRACGDGCVDGSAPRRGPRAPDDRRCRTSRRTSTRRRRSHPAASY